MQIEQTSPVTTRRGLFITEIDAAAFHAYGLNREDTKFVLDDFHRVENPRLMDEPYFEMVLEGYDELVAEGPMEWRYQTPFLRILSCTS